MTGVITAVTTSDVEDSNGIIVADDTDGTFYYMPRRTAGVLVESRSFNGFSSWKAQPLKPLMGKRVRFSINAAGEAYNVELIDN